MSNEITQKEFVLKYKQCSTCKVFKTRVDDFQKQSDKKDGLCSQCKECASKRSRKYEKEKSLDPEWRKKRSEKSLRRYKEIIKDPILLEKERERDRNRIKKINPISILKSQARSMVNNALKNGRIRKSDCEECQSNESVQAHHDDYSKPLQVRWLCIKCHNILHRKYDHATI